MSGRKGEGSLVERVVVRVGGLLDLGRRGVRGSGLKVLEVKKQ